MVANSPKKTKQSKDSESWAGAVKAVGLRAVARGQLVSFGLLIIAGIAVWRIDGGTVEKLFQISVDSGIALWFGWLMFFVTFCAALVLITAQRNIYRNEIKRLASERTALQMKLSPAIQSSTSN